MNITGSITGIKYKIILAHELQKIELDAFNINDSPSACVVINDVNSFAISKWVSPKRTRSYPYERVYNTLLVSKKITVIPIVKDEGAKGDRDFIQWDTVSLMSLLDVFVVFAYYIDAEKLGEKISNQQFDNQYVLEKIKEIGQYHSSALHWNLNELNTGFYTLIDKVKDAYTDIENKTSIKLHNFVGLERFKTKIGKDVLTFMDFSRGKAKEAQSREFVTVQPKENLSTVSKGKITIKNYLGGQYFFTVDEIKISNNIVHLIESKHSKNSILPSKGDIKDGLLKMILYANLSKVIVNDIEFESEAILNLTSNTLVNGITSGNSESEINDFFLTNNFSENQMSFIKNLFEEANENNFVVSINESKK